MSQGLTLENVRFRPVVWLPFSCLRTQLRHLGEVRTTPRLTSSSGDRAQLYSLVPLTSDSDSGFAGLESPFSKACTNVNTKIANEIFDHGLMEFMLKGV